MAGVIDQEQAKIIQNNLARLNYRIKKVMEVSIYVQDGWDNDRYDYVTGMFPLNEALGLYNARVNKDYGDIVGEGSVLLEARRMMAQLTEVVASLRHEVEKVGLNFAVLEAAQTTSLEFDKVNDLPPPNKPENFEVLVEEVPEALNEEPEEPEIVEEDTKPVSFSEPDEDDD